MPRAPEFDDGNDVFGAVAGDDSLSTLLFEADFSGAFAASGVNEADAFEFVWTGFYGEPDALDADEQPDTLCATALPDDLIAPDTLFWGGTGSDLLSASDLEDTLFGGIAEHAEADDYRPLWFPYMELDGGHLETRSLGMSAADIVDTLVCEDIEAKS